MSTSSISIPRFELSEGEIDFVGGAGVVNLHHLGTDDYEEGQILVDEDREDFSPTHNNNNDDDDDGESEDEEYDGINHTHKHHQHHANDDDDENPNRFVIESKTIDISQPQSRDNNKTNNTSSSSSSSSTQVIQPPYEHRNNTATQSTSLVRITTTRTMMRGEGQKV